MSAKYVFPRRARGILAPRADQEPGWYYDGRHKKWRPWVLAHLKGGRPVGHPEDIDRYNNKRPVPAVGQVWVQPEGYLVTIVALQNQGRFIQFIYYECPCCEVETMSRESFTMNHKLWEDKLASCKKIIQKLVSMVTDGKFPTLEDAARAFGIDPKSGVRVG